ncbi:MAG: ABC transporter ATP-binding protein [Candidatus Omnitrophica bacterium]|nr:ABC transporter ATP-binding protein [Candidatus Omnitrophota bacterium]
MKTYFRLIKYVRPHLWILAVAAVFMVLSSALQPISFSMLIPFIDKVLIGQNITIVEDRVPHFILELISTINSMPRKNLLFRIVPVALVLFVLRFTFAYIQQYFMRETSQRVVRDIRNIIYDKLLRLSLGFYSRSQTGTLISRITYDSTVIQDAVAEGLTDLVFQSCLFVFTLAMIIFIAFASNIDLIFIFLILFVMPLVVIPLLKMGKRLKQISRKAQESMANINNILYETISGIRIVKAFCMEAYERIRFKGQNEAFKKSVMKSNKRILAVSPISEFFTLICVMAIIVFAGVKVIEGEQQVGSLAAFIGLILTLGKPIKRLSRVHAVNQQAVAAATRIFDILDAEVDIKEKKNAIKLPPLTKNIIVSNISFKYDEKEVLQDISFDAQAGNVVAFVGPSGAGKTTLVSLIARFYDPISGSVEIDGHDIRDITVDSLRDQIGIVTQETVLFNDAVNANIGYGRSDFDMGKVIDAAKTANAHDFIMKMPKQYDTIIGDRGFKLSGGEKQRLAIARAIFKNPPILIFDEATSQLDSESEKLVQGAIDRLMMGRTVFVIAHRLSTIKHADTIIVMDKGKIADRGKHQELINRGGLYKKLYTMQFMGL